MKYTPTERVGISATEHIFTSKFNWIFREQPISDMGIDAHIEIVNDGVATGQLIGLQIKTGESYWKEQSNGNFVYYIDDEHYSYWLSHSLPVFIIIHHPEKEITLWQQVNEKKIEKLDKSWKLIIPKENQLKPEFKSSFEEVTPSGEYEKKELQLKLHYPLLKAIKDGKSVILETNEWVHNSLNRGGIKILINTGSVEQEAFKWPFYSTLPIEEMINHFFPWYTVSIDTDWYESNFNEESVGYIYNVLPRVYPWVIHSGEYAEYRLELNLSKLGESFLEVNEFLSDTA